MAIILRILIYFLAVLSCTKVVFWNDAMQSPHWTLYSVNCSELCVWARYRTKGNSFRHYEKHNITYVFNVTVSRFLKKKKHYYIVTNRTTELRAHACFVSSDLRDVVVNFALETLLRDTSKNMTMFAPVDFSQMRGTEVGLSLLSSRMMASRMKNVSQYVVLSSNSVCLSAVTDHRDPI